MENGGKTEVRTFDWRDLFLVQRLQSQGQILNHETARVDGIFPLRDALHNYLLLGTGERQTIVLPGLDAFVQHLYAQKSRRAHLTYLAPALKDDGDADRWIEILERLVAALGAKGTHHIVAEARANGPEMEVLQRAGFGVLTRQVLLGLTGSSHLGDELPALPGLRPWRTGDEWGVRLLYANIVPHLAQQIESPADSAFISKYWQHRLVLERDGEIIASLAARRGRVGSALRLLLHPEADVHIEPLIGHALQRLVHGPPQPVFCRVRRYESWVQVSLEAYGFVPVVSTALLVKHTVARVMTPEWHLAPAIEGRPEVTTPVTRARLNKS